ncbi:MAG: hypothetical protein CMI08_08785 [Oceanospirillaceae bacterium]|uniref:DUF4124 domain-containing protein n=1 Tax=unclassified Thalassolituus TaxID=2624967 RepID=UPI000C097916|nr:MULTISPECIES: DUF4124 domain-containing protein [unclassified Thalassolituus]MAK91219.1 hypothetical protein [Thalassolituus sp.]MAS24318.1 hypothetical protein [Oceanospirillaceae bacterium]MAX99287.1 hypothetical protein [Oceanospirillaceae bacterium]MBL33385.1 hypothetical protein [Oceanospirillaceae bacterium]MBS51262.1 hypothetical protein [Oceanospirillaceae bacterium]
MKYRLALKLLPLFVVLAIMVATPYVMKGGFSMDSVPEIIPDVLSTTQTRQTYYKWQDASGQWHMGDEVPEGVNAVPVEIDTAANILKSVGLPEPAEQSKPEVAAEEPAPIPGVPMTVNPADIPKLLQDTDKLKAMMEQRNKQIDQGY